MLCHSFISKIGFDCRLTKSLNGGDALHITTPIDLLDGTPFSFYIAEDGIESDLFTDNGDTLFHLMSCGLVGDNRNSWKALKAIAINNNLLLNDEGEISSRANKSDYSFAIADMLSFACALKVWQEDRIGQHANSMLFIDEVELALKTWKPARIISRKPSAQGLSEKKYEFDFLFGDYLVDAMTPNGRATGAKLRKLLDVQRGPQDIKSMIVIDDRFNPDLALIEGNILGSITEVIAYTDIEKNISILH